MLNLSIGFVAVKFHNQSYQCSNYLVEEKNQEHYQKCLFKHFIVQQMIALATIQIYKLKYSNFIGGI